jgi:hypothetical protein
MRVLGATDFDITRSAFWLTAMVTDAEFGYTPGSAVVDVAAAELESDEPAKFAGTDPTMVMVAVPTPRSPREHAPVARTHVPAVDEIEDAVNPDGNVSERFTAWATEGPRFSTVTV